MRVRRSPAKAFAAVLLVLAGLSCSSPSEPAEPSQLLISVGNVSLDAIGATLTATPTVRDQRNRIMSNVTGIAWTTNNAAAATVSNTGVITATGNGTATVTATLDGLTASAIITVAQVPVAPVVVSGNFQSAPTSTALAQALQVRVEDRLGVAIPGVTVTFAVTSGGGSLSTTSVASDGAGLASTTWTLGSTTAALQRATASAAGAGTATLFSATALAGPPTQMIIASGNAANGQVVTISQAVPVRPAVEVRDVVGNVVVGATVTFTVGTGGGSVTGGAAVTDNAGVATVGSWTAGPTPGVNTVQATLGALTPVVFTVNAVADRCAPEGAQPLTLGVAVNANISGADCPGSFTFEGTFYDYRYEYYRLDLVSRTSLAFEMNASFDTWLSVYDFNTQALIAENDDIIRGVNLNSRVGITLDPGSYLIRARGFDATQAGDYSLLVRTALIGVPASIVANAPDGQVAAPGATTPTVPSVTVLDELGTPVVGTTVNFSTVGGIGSVGTSSAVTGANGIASAGSWTLAAGANVLTATVSGGATVTGNPVIYSAKGKASSAGFDVSLRFATVPTATQLTIFSNAAARWEAIITGDISSVPVNFPIGTCGSSNALAETIDDLVIVVRLEPIDGINNVLGSAGPCFTRATGNLPVLGTMRFDTADLTGLENSGGLGDVILHEMGHVLGVGTIWSNRGLLQLASPNTGTGFDTHFSGANAITAFNAAGGATYTGGLKVPVENSAGGAGTRNSHWRESVLDRELMTGFYDGGVVNPLSAITVQSMLDLGYTVDAAAADPFTFFSSLRAESQAAGQVLWLKDDVRQGPIIPLDRFGRPVGATVRPPKGPKSVW